MVSSIGGFILVQNIQAETYIFVAALKKPETTARQKTGCKKPFQYRGSKIQVMWMGSDLLLMAFSLCNS